MRFGRWFMHSEARRSVNQDDSVKVTDYRFVSTKTNLQHPVREKMPAWHFQIQPRRPPGAIRQGADSSTSSIVAWMEIFPS